MSISKYIRSPYIRQRGSRRGFTLVELLAVVAMIGILAAIATVGYRRYLLAARTGDAKAIVASIRISQESYKAETLSYLDCSTSLTDYYPAPAPNKKQRTFKQSKHPKWPCWGQLNVVTDSPTAFVFAVRAGNASQKPPAPSTKSKPTWPVPTEPWYVVQAAGDIDEDGEYVYVLGSSFTGDLYVENEGE